MSAKQCLHCTTFYKERISTYQLRQSQHIHFLIKILKRIVDLLTMVFT